MFELFNQQRHQQRSGNLTLSLFGSILIHAFVALALSLRQTSESSQIAKPASIPITITELPQKRSPTKVFRQSKPKSQVKTTAPTPKITKDSAVTTKPTAPPQAKTTPSPVSKADSPPVLTNGHPQAPSFYGGVRVTSNQSNIKSPKIATPPQVDPEVENLIRNEKPSKSSSSAIVTKPRLNPPLSNRKPLTSSQSKPPKPDTPEQVNNTAVPPNLNNQESTQGKESSPVNNSEGSTAGQAESKTAADNIPDKLAQPLAISCEENCQPEYPSVLDGAEGSARIQLTIDRDGNVIDAAIANPNVNPQLNQEALEAAEDMEFSSIDRDRATIRVNISFTVAGSDFEQQAKEEQEKREERKKQ